MFTRQMYSREKGVRFRIDFSLNNVNCVSCALGQIDERAYFDDGVYKMKRNVSCALCVE